MKYKKMDECIDLLIKQYNNKLLDIIANYPEEINTLLLDALKNTVMDNIKPREIKTIHDLAKLLDNNDYSNELKNEYNIDVEDICRKNKWIICFPYSDDCFESRGYIDEELGAWNGGFYKICKKGDFYLDDENEETYKKAKSDILIQVGDLDVDYDISIKWCDGKIYQNNQKYVWDIIVENDNLPHAYFNIIDKDSEDEYEANEIWAKCCIIDCSSIL